MPERTLPKLSLLRLSSHVADLILVSDGSIEAVKEPRTRFAWHLLFFSVIIYTAISLIGDSFLGGYLSDSTQLALGRRWFKIVASLWLLATLCFLAYRHYRFLLLTGKDLRFRNIVFFFSMGVILFGHLYQALYILSPTLFTYPDTFVSPTDKAVQLHFPLSSLFSGDFTLYSACVAVSVGYPRIASASALISFINVVEVVASFLITALLIATFVQKTKPENTKP